MDSASVSHLLAMTAVIALTLPALAQDTSGPDLAPAAESAASGGVSTLSLAQDLYRIGVTLGDAVTVLSAAKLAASVTMTSVEPAVLDPAKISFADETASPGKRGLPVEGPDVPIPMNGSTPRAVAKASFVTATSEEDGAADGPVTPEEMFATAKELAAGNDTLLGVIKAATAEGPSGRIGGTFSWLSPLAAGSTDVWQVPIYANAYTEIAVMGDGDANLDVVVTDREGNVLCNDVGWSDALYCDFIPAQDGYFYVTVENVGGAGNSYHLLTN